MAARKVKVAVIGGGCASIAAVWELSRPEHDGRYEITVYQEGWRLGGKGASGRGANGRIEEHGLHIWLGFYDNAFRMMRECYAELEAAGAGSLFGAWHDAFTPENDIALVSAAEQGGFQRWDAHMPPRPGLPGDPLPPGEVFSMPYYMSKAFDLFRALILDTTVDGRGVGEGLGAAPPGDIAGQLKYLAQLGTFATAAALAEAVGVLAVLVRSAPASAEGRLLEAADAVLARLRAWLESRWLADDAHRFVWEVADLTLASMVGVIRHGVMFDPRGLDAIDDYECREWLQMNGASERALQSPFLRGLYDLSMGYENGDPDRPCLSAGQGLRGTVRTFFSYRGAFIWRMRAGMGDVVFAPLYEVLRRRGVRFEFFHRLTNVGLSAPAGGDGGDHVRSLVFDVQAKTRGGGAYEPLIEVQGRPCWPSKPDYSQLADGARLAARDGNSSRTGTGDGPASERWKSPATSISSCWASASGPSRTSAARYSTATRAGGR